MSSQGFFCLHCGKEHPGKFSFAADFPDPYANLKRDDRDARAAIGSDQCIVDGDQFYLRGCIELPIVGSDDVFLWGVWARVHEKDYDIIAEFWEIEGRERKIGPFKGRLANSLSIYPGTINMKLQILIEPVGVRPRFVLEEPKHPFSIEQRAGLTIEKAREYACLLMRMSPVYDI